MPAPLHRGGKALGRREHVRRAVRVGELGVPAQVHRTGDVASSVFLVAAPVVERTQVPPAVDDPYGRIVEVLREPVRRHEGTERGEVGGSLRRDCHRRHGRERRCHSLGACGSSPCSRSRACVELAQLAEREGAEACFLADEGTDRDLYVALTAIVLSTERMTVAPAITNPFSRHPVATAAAIATLAELAPGRVWHGLGVGGSRVLAPLGLTPERPYTALRDAVDVNKRLLGGEAVGEARLAWAPGPIPIAIAGRGPRVKALATSEADWIILSAEPPATLPSASKAAAVTGRQARVVRLSRLRPEGAPEGARALLVHGARRASRDPRPCRTR